MDGDYVAVHVVRRELRQPTQPVYGFAECDESAIFTPYPKNCATDWAYRFIADGRGIAVFRIAELYFALDGDPNSHRIDVNWRPGIGAMKSENASC